MNLGDSMLCRLADMREKQVVCIKDGSILGLVSDFELDTESGRLVSILIYGRRRLFGIFGRDADCKISWESIEVIGEDSILVNCEGYSTKSVHRGGLLSEIFMLK